MSIRKSVLNFCASLNVEGTFYFRVKNTFVHVKFGHPHQSRYTNRGVYQLTNELRPKISFKILLNHTTVSQKSPTEYKLFLEHGLVRSKNRLLCNGGWTFKGEWLFWAYPRTLFSQKFLTRGHKFLLYANLAMRTLKPILYTGLFISPSGTSELDCATTKKDTTERRISIGRESLKVFLY